MVIFLIKQSPENPEPSDTTVCRRKSIIIFIYENGTKLVKITEMQKIFEKIFAKICFDVTLSSQI